MASARGLLFLVYLILGLYFINFGLNFIKLSESFSSINNWIVPIGGIFLIFAGISHLTRRTYNRY